MLLALSRNTYIRKGTLGLQFCMAQACCEEGTEQDRSGHQKMKLETRAVTDALKRSKIGERDSVL